MIKNNLYQAKPIALPFIDDPIGELYEDIYIVPIKYSDGEIKNHLIQSGRFYIREYSLNSWNDIIINPETLIDVTDYEMPVFVGDDLVKNLDVTLISEKYPQNEELLK